MEPFLWQANSNKNAFESSHRASKMYLQSIVKMKIETLFQWPGNSKEVLKVAPQAFVKSRLPSSSANTPSLLPTTPEVLE